MNGQFSLKNVINRIIDRRGKEVLHNEKIFMGMFLDFAPALVKERKLFKLFFSENIMDRLIEFDQGKFNIEENELLESCANELNEMYGVGRKEVCFALKCVLDSLKYQELSNDILESELAKNLPLICTKAYEGDRIAFVLFASRRYLFSAKERESFFFEIFNLATSGNSFAQVCMGEFYDQGEVVAKNREIACIWFKIASDAGNPAGLNARGTLMYADKTISRMERRKKEMEFYQEAAQKGYWAAKSNLAIYFEEEHNYNLAKEKYIEVIDECPSPYLRDYYILQLAILLKEKLHDLSAAQYWIAKILGIKDYDDKLRLLRLMSKNRDLGYDISYIVQELEKMAEEGGEKGIITLIVLFSGRKGRPETAVPFTDEDLKTNRNLEKCKYWINRYIEKGEKISRDIIDLYLLNLSDEDYQIEKNRIDDLYKFSDEDEYVTLFHDLKWSRSTERIEECKSLLKQKKLMDYRKHPAGVLEEMISYYGNRNSECKDISASLFYTEQKIALLAESGSGDGELEYDLYEIYHSGIEDIPANPELANYWYKKASDKNCTKILIEKAKLLFREKKFTELRTLLEENDPLKRWSSKYGKEYSKIRALHLGYCYSKGVGGVNVDHVKAASFFQASNTIYGMNMLAAFYKKGYPDFPQDLQKFEECKAKVGDQYKDYHDA